MAENNHGKTRRSANQTGKCSLSFTHAVISEHYKDIIVLFCLLLKSLLLPEVSEFFADSNDPQYVFNSRIQ